ncbi:SurA N-terminal domain-containing protein [Chitinilyticum litopenaei]|uniref:SurA N-terminal domain-containing protein n=1 Tax=Chitinilyticum litopenaei TaxID=1121276 RepID=UPI0009DBDAFE|nr:SurA N-terminal domain-containing protein [Chitinilyticum litopenaei]
MFDFVQKNKTAAQILLGCVALGLIVTGGLSLSDMGEEPPLAKVGSSKITGLDFYRFTNGENVPDEQKAAVLEQLIQERLLTLQGKESGLAISDADLAELIKRNISASEGQFDPERYKEMLKARNMTVEQYEEMVRKNVIINQLLQPVFASNFVSTATLELMNRILGETRHVAVATLPVQDFLAKVSISPEEVNNFYKANQALFKQPETARLEYIVLSQEQLSASITVPDAEISKYFNEHKQELAKEERKIRVLQLNFPASADDAAKAAVRKEAQALQAQLKAAPATFAEVAKAKSQDPISAPNGGDLGYLAKGVSGSPAFDTAAFGLAKGQVSDVIETPQGVSILLVDDIKARQLAEVKPEIEARLKQQQVQAQLQKMVEDLNEVLYQEASSLKPAADKFKLTIQTSDWVSRKGAAAPELNKPKLLEAVFDADVVKSKHNTSAVEVAPGVYVAARIVEHRPEQVAKLDEVKAQIEQQLKLEKAGVLAKQDGEAKLKQLQAGTALGLNWSAAQPVRQEQAVAMPGPAKDIFKAKLDKLPAYVGTDVPGRGYMIMRIEKVEAAQPLNAQSREQLTGMLQQQQSNREALALIDHLKTQYKVSAPASKKEAPAASAAQ